MKDPLRRLVAAAIVVVSALALPAAASAAGSISASVNPGVPAKAKSFAVRAKGTADNTGGDRSYVFAFLAPDTVACAATPDVTGSTANGIRVLYTSVGDGAFDQTAAVTGGAYPFASGTGVKAGRYRICAYVSDQSGDFKVQATDRIEFTVGGTCAKARASLRKANRRLRRAKRALRRARTRRQARRARKAVKKARKGVKKAKASRKTFC